MTFLEQASNDLNQMLWLNRFENEALKPRSYCHVSVLMRTATQRDCGDLTTLLSRQTSNLFDECEAVLLWHLEVANQKAWGQLHNRF